MLKRKANIFLLEWKNKLNHKPLIVSGARQVGKTTSIREFGKTYKSFIEINFIFNQEYKHIFNNNLDVNTIIKELSLLNPSFKFIEHDTLIFFDEIQECREAISSLKAFSEDRRFDVICSGSSLGINYKRILSVPVGHKEEYIMRSLDFEEFLWALSYKEEQIDDLFSYMKDLKTLPDIYLKVFSQLYRDYIFIGGMPEVVQTYVHEKTFTNVFLIQKRIYKDYEDDITNYVEGLDKAKVKNVYRHISSQLAKDNHKFQISKLGHGARAREYKGIKEWLLDVGIINIAYNLESLELPLASYELKDNYRIYYGDHSLFIATLDEEAKKDLIINNNYNIYNGALYESLISEELVKQGYPLYFYKNETSTIELDFLIRIKNQIIPIEVKRKKGRTKSLAKALLQNINIKYGIKLVDGNIGFENNKLTFPHFLTFLLKRFINETNYID